MRPACKLGIDIAYLRPNNCSELRVVNKWHFRGEKYVDFGAAEM